MTYGGGPFGRAFHLHTELVNGVCPMCHHLSIFVGASGGIVEALERGYKVMHICEFPIIDFYSDKIWSSIKTKQLSPNLFLYEIKKTGNIIRLGNKPKSLDTFFRN